MKTWTGSKQPALEAPSLVNDGTDASEHQEVSHSTPEAFPTGLAAKTDESRTPTPSPTRSKTVTFGEGDKEDNPQEPLAPPALKDLEPCPSINEKEAKAASILQEAAKISSGAPSSAPPGLEGLGESSTGVGDGEQPGLKEDVEKLKPPPAGKGRRILRPHELRGLPEDISVERLTEDIEEDFKTFNSVNPQFDQNPEIAWYYFKDIHRRYGLPIEDSDWTGNPEDIGLVRSGSQPEKPFPGREL